VSLVAIEQENAGFTLKTNNPTRIVAYNVHYVKSCFVANQRVTVFCLFFVHYSLFVAVRHGNTWVSAPPGGPASNEF
jgi:hypothetical protein